MKPNTVLAKTEGSLGGRSVAMQIDANSIAHIMSVLTELYSDPAMAVVREYSVNARDSHIEAGQTRPIEVSTPNAMNRYFKVKDYGVGLSVDDLTDMYSKYGASTKRGTDTQTGMLGLGSKSALAYTNQFTIVSVKNGVKATVSVRRIEDGTGVMEIIDTKATDEPNGVEIVIPVQRLDEFERRCKDFFRFWEPGTVLINGVEPESVNKESTQILPHIWIRRADAYSGQKDVIVMGNVPYPISDRLNHYYVITAYLPIGSVNFTPSREELHLTDLTKAAIKTLKDELTAAVIKVGTDAIANAPTRWEAVEAYKKFNQTYGIKIPDEYKGVKFDQGFSVTATDTSHLHTYYRPLQARNHVSTGRQYTPSPVNSSSVLAITNFPHGVLSADRKAKIRGFIRNLPDYRTQRYDTVLLFTGAPEYTTWLNPSRVTTWAEVDKIALNKPTPAQRKATPPSYEVCQKAGGTKSEASLTGPILYFSPRDFRENGQDYYYIAKTFPNHTVVSLGANRWDKFLRDYPQAVELREYVKAQEKPLTAALTQDDIDSRNYPSDFAEVAKQLDLSLIDDPEFVDVLTRKPRSATLIAWEAFNDMKIVTFGYGANFPSAKSDAKFEKMRKRYHMFFAARKGYYYTFNKAEVTAYINAIYAIKENKA